jgi:hypothetical protein
LSKDYLFISLVSSAMCFLPVATHQRVVAQERSFQFKNNEKENWAKKKETKPKFKDSQKKKKRQYLIMCT